MSPLGEDIRLGWARKDIAPAIGLVFSLEKGETPMFFLYQECSHLPGRRKFLLRNKPWHFDLGLSVFRTKQRITILSAMQSKFLH